MDIHHFHRQTIIIDGHEDISYQVLKKNLDFGNDRRSLTQVSLPHLQNASVNLVFGAIFLENKEDLPSVKEHLKIYKNLAKKYNFKIIKNSKEIEKIRPQKDLGFIIHLEGAEPIRNERDLENLYKANLRSISLTWKNKNHLAGGNLSSSGLTFFGKKILNLAQKLKMIIDLAHLNKKSFYQVLQNTKGPVIVSHSNCEELCNYKNRNLDSCQIKAIAKRNGVIGINVYNKMLSSNSRATIKTVCDHIDYIKNLVGIDYVGLGSDFAGIKTKRTPNKFSNIGELKNLTRELINRNYKNEEIQKILGLNFLRVIKKIL